MDSWWPAPKTTGQKYNCKYNCKISTPKFDKTDGGKIFFLFFLAQKMALKMLQMVKQQRHNFYTCSENIGYFLEIIVIGSSYIILDEKL